MVTVLGLKAVLSLVSPSSFVRCSNVLLNTFLLIGSCEFLQVMSRYLGFLFVTVESIHGKHIS